VVPSEPGIAEDSILIAEVHLPAFIGTFCLHTDYSWVLFGTRYPAIGGLLKISLTIPEALVVVDCGWSHYGVVFSSLMIEQLLVSSS